MKTSQYWASVAFTWEQFQSVAKHFSVSQMWKSCLYNYCQISQWPMSYTVNSLRPSDTIWWQRSGSSLAQVMACCLTAPSHCLNQCWLIINNHSRNIHLWASSQELPQSLITQIIWKIKYLKCHSNFPGTNELNKRIKTKQNWNQFTKTEVFSLHYFK